MSLIVVVSLICLTSYFLVDGLPRPWARATGAARNAAALRLVKELSKAIEAYRIDHGAYPHGDGSNSRMLVKALCQLRVVNGLPYSVFLPDMIRDGNVINPAVANGILYYRANNISTEGGVNSKKKPYELWGEDAEGNKDGISVWSIGVE